MVLDNLSSLRFLDLLRKVGEKVGDECGSCKAHLWPEFDQNVKQDDIKIMF